MNTLFGQVKIKKNIFLKIYIYQLIVYHKILIDISAKKLGLIPYNQLILCNQFKKCLMFLSKPCVFAANTKVGLRYVAILPVCYQSYQSPRLILLKVFGGRSHPKNIDRTKRFFCLNFQLTMYAKISFNFSGSNS